MNAAMKKACLMLALLPLLSVSLQAQKYFTRDGHVSFFSDTPMEKIEAHNHKASSVLDVATSRIEFAVLIQAFQFEKALMQEHFNENYMESDKYPKATFKGQIVDPSAVNFSRSGSYNVQVKGQLTIHGVTKEVTAPAVIKVQGGQVSATSTFNVAVADYNISVPALVRDNIARNVRIDVAVSYQPMNN